MKKVLKKPLTLRETVQMPQADVKVVLSSYQHGALLAVQLVAAADGKNVMQGEPMGTLSYNPVDPAVIKKAKDGEFFCKTWYENEPLIAPLLASGLFEPVSASPEGSVIWRLKGSALSQYLEELDRQNEEESLDDKPSDDGDDVPRNN